MIDRFAKSILVFGLFMSTPCAWSQQKPEPVLRTEGPMVDIRLNKNRSLMAYTDQLGQSLRIMDMETQEIVEVTPHRVGPSFFWSPDGKRLFYRELIHDKKSVTSEIKAYDTFSEVNASIDTVPGSTGYLTFDPRDFTVLAMHEKGITSKRLQFPGERLARWQKRAKVELGRFVVTQKAVLWVNDMGLTLNALSDDGSGVESFDISPDGKLIAWTTRDFYVYVSEAGETPRVLGRGRDARWHSSKSLLLYSAARMVGPKAYDFDVRVSDRLGNGRYLTSTPEQAERWPQWWDDKSIIFTVQNSTDLWKQSYEKDVALTASEGPENTGAATAKANPLHKMKTKPQ